MIKEHNRLTPPTAQFVHVHSIVRPYAGSRYPTILTLRYRCHWGRNLG